MKTTDSFNRSLDFNTKLKYFIVAWLLVEEIIFWGVRSFLLILNNISVTHFGTGYDPTQIIWSENPMWNIVRSLLTSTFAFGFGVAFAYLARKIRENDKVTISLVNAIFAVFGTLILTFLFDAIPAHYTLHDLFVGLNSDVRSSSVFAIFLILQLVVAGACTYAGLSQGAKWSARLPEDVKGRLLGVKWYHYLWLWFGVEVYVSAFLYLVYITLHALRLFVAHFSLWDVLGASSSDGSSRHNSLDSLVGTLVFVYIIAIVIFSIIRYQRDILSGDKKASTLQKIGVSLVVSGVVPLLLVIYTVLGNDSVR